MGGQFLAKTVQIPSSRGTVHLILFKEIDYLPQTLIL